MKNTFDALGLTPNLLGVVEQLGYAEPTPIQIAAIPMLLEGRDLIGQAKTGSGKTAAFGLPCLQRLDLELRSPQALVLCPTRELAAQVAREIRKLGRENPGLSVLEVVGGQPSRPQREALTRGVHVVIGTPGRVLDHLERGFLDPSELQTAVLDEADRMLDMGFGEDVSRILKSLPSERQTVLFSATFPDSIASISRRFQRNATHITIAEPEEGLGDIRQWQLQADAKDRTHALARVLHQFPHDSALVFCNFKATVNKLVHQLAGAGLSIDRLDGDLDQFHRDQVLARFRNNSVRILVATDVAGRGLDVQNLDLVVNYELPPQPETYVHRIGRTGRAGSQGVAVSLTSHSDDARIADYERLTGAKIERLRTKSQQDSNTDRLLQTLAGQAPMATILISGGRKDKVRPGDIVGALTGEAGGLAGDEVGKIEVQDRLSYVAVAQPRVAEAVKQLNAGRIKGKKFRATHVGSEKRSS